MSSRTAFHNIATRSQGLSLLAPQNALEGQVPVHSIHSLIAFECITVLSSSVVVFLFCQLCAFAWQSRRKCRVSSQHNLCHFRLTECILMFCNKVLKSPKLSKRRSTIFVGKNPNPWGGGGLDGILNPSSPPHPTQPTPYKRTQKDPSVQQSNRQGGNWWCLSDTFHFSHWNELSKLPC